MSWADSKIPAEVCVVVTLLRADVHDPGHMFGGFIIEGIQRRFWISFDYSQWISGLPKNICSAGKPINLYVEEEVKAGLLICLPSGMPRGILKPR